MTATYSPGSFTKNFSWDESYLRLHRSISNGFAGDDAPVTRERWRAQSGIADADRQLIPLNFFLHSIHGLHEDYVLVDQLVDTATDAYSDQFAQLALFSFHLANSGTWRNSKWPDGRVAGWANEFICNHAWMSDDWASDAFLDSALMTFIEENIDAEPVTKRKVFTNYRYMLQSAGILQGDALQPKNLRQRWLVDAIQLYWDRQILDGKLPSTANAATLEDSLVAQEIYKLLRCDIDQCIAFARAAYAEFSHGQAVHRANQVATLRDRGLIAA
ncbi:MAG TPA: hypothetical protein VFC54_14565 [Pseudolabrys sp.]|nr:hypothetical protein [Pseudolabrys sp.]